MATVEQLPARDLHLKKRHMKSMGGFQKVDWGHMGWALIAVQQRIGASRLTEASPVIIGAGRPSGQQSID